jgi:hypothetical protein
MRLLKLLSLTLVLGVLLAIVGGGLGGPVKAFDRQMSIVPLSSNDHSVDFMGKQRASAVAEGDGHSYLGLYVYDSQGNCVAWDDHGMLLGPQKLQVDWYPPTTGVYVIEVRNCGLESNECKLVLR